MITRVKLQQIKPILTIIAEAFTAIMIFATAYLLFIVAYAFQ